MELFKKIKRPKKNLYSLNISIVIPLLNEADSLPELHAWIKRVLDAEKLSYEIIFIDDGSTDESWSIIQNLKSSHPEVKGLKFRRNYGKSAALNEGFGLAQGDSVFTMDSDLQDSPDELPVICMLCFGMKTMILSVVGKKRDLIQLPKQYQQNFIIGLLVK